LVSQTPSGNANTSVIVRNTWTIETRPRSSAAAWNAHPTTMTPNANSQTGRTTSRRSDPGLRSDTLGTS